MSREGGSAKEAMADEARSRRGYRETYGRGGGERFQTSDFPRSYPVPGAMDWRRALRAYVAGHDRGWEADRKYREAGSGEERETSPAREDEPRRYGAPTGGEPAEQATARPEAGGRFGVGVPDRDELRFHRGASVWRDRLPAARRLPRHTDRGLGGQEGTGGQA